jgi:hypothetical protein
MKKTWILVFWAFLQAVPAAAAELRLTSPNGGETVCLGRPLRITWQATGVGQRVRLVLRRSGAGAVGEIAANIDAAMLSYDWTDAGALAAGRATAGDGYLVRLVTLDGSLADTSDAPFSLRDCGGAVLRPGGEMPTAQAQAQFSRPDLPAAALKKTPKLRITDFEYSYGQGQNQFIAWVKSVGDAPFIGTIRVTWTSPCGGHQETRTYYHADEWHDVDPQRGWPFILPCTMPRAFCAVHASCTIEPTGADGTHYERLAAEEDFPCYSLSQFLLASRRLKFIFLNGSRWVECGSQCVITANDAYDYDPETGMATFTVGFPLRNCGTQAGRFSEYPGDALSWSMFHTPSNSDAGGGFVCPNACSSSPVEPGQAILVERTVSLKVRAGLTMLNLHSGPLPGGVLHGAIRFAEDLLR